MATGGNSKEDLSGSDTEEPKVPRSRRSANASDGGGRASKRPLDEENKKIPEALISDIREKNSLDGLSKAQKKVIMAAARETPEWKALADQNKKLKESKNPAVPMKSKGGGKGQGSRPAPANRWCDNCKSTSHDTAYCWWGTSGKGGGGKGGKGSSHWAADGWQ